ncbi:MAG: GNAT family N-acetyltransferase [Clostridia bacterium]|jgi:GNAT superfamily N-acetyltransferase
MTEVYLILASDTDAEALLSIQKNAFLPLFESYQDGNLNPYSETLEQMKQHINEGYFYKIMLNDCLVGGIMARELEKDMWKLRIIFIEQEFQGKGIAQTAIGLMEKIHSDVNEWVLDTPHDLYKNHHIYEKCGYVRTSEITPVNERLALIHYRKKR